MQRTCRKSKQKWSFWSGQSWRRLQRHQKVESARWGGDHVPTKLMVPSYLTWALLWGPKSNCWWGEAEECQSQRKKTLPPEKAPGGNSPLTALRGPAPQPYCQSTGCLRQHAQISYPVTKQLTWESGPAGTASPLWPHTTWGKPEWGVSEQQWFLN